MADIDWDSIDSKFGGSYAQEGIYKVKCTGVTIEEKGTKGNALVKFEVEGEAGVTYPTLDHWLTYDKDKTAWRCHHAKELMVVLGATEDAAKKAVQTAENCADKAKAIATYTALFKKLLAKKPTIEIEVFKQYNEKAGKSYSRSEFTDSRVAMPHDNTPKPSSDDDLLDLGDGGVTMQTTNNDSINIDEIPF